MLYRYLLFVLVLFSGIKLFAQEAERSPFKPTDIPISSSQFSEEQWDVQFDYDLQALSGLGSAGAEYAGDIFYVTKWNRNMFLRFASDGTFIDSLPLGNYSGATGVRDLAWDGQYLYGGIAAGNMIAVIDPTIMSVISTITTSVASIRSIAYDQIRDGFWVSGWNDALTCVSRTGTVIATMTNVLTAKYGSAYDPYTPEGPFLWVWDQSQGQGFPQLIHQFDLTTLQATGVTFDIKTKITTAGANAIAGGLFITKGLAMGKATLGGVFQGAPDRLFGLELANTESGPLNPFVINSPEAGITVTTFPGSHDDITFAWDTAAAGATYNWVFGTALPQRLLTQFSSTNSLTITLGELDEILNDAGVAQGESLVGSWDIWAYRNNAENDSLKSTNGPRAITLKRELPTLSPFNLYSPPSGATLVTSSNNSSTVMINWGSSGPGVMYQWKFGIPSIATPVFTMISNNDGLDTMMTMKNYEVDATLASFGLNPGDSVIGQWAVWGYAGNDSLKSAQTFDLTLKRQGRGEVLVTYDSTITDSRTSLDSVTAVLARYGITYEIMNRGTISSTISFSLRDFKKVIWLGENTSTASAVQRDSIKAYLSGGTSGMKSKLIVFSEDIGWQHGRPSSSNLDLDFLNNYLGVDYLADRPTSGANQGLVGVEINSGITDSTIGVYPEVLGPYIGTNWVPLYQFRGLDSLNAIGNLTDNFTVATFGVDISSLRPAIDSPPGSPVERFVIGALNFVDGIVGVRDNNSSAPSQYVLLQNYPNPFNPATKIQYSLAGTQLVTLKIYDILGREIRTLINKTQDAGYYTIEFDASNLPSGTYIYKLSAGSFVSTQKMMLVK